MDNVNELWGLLYRSDAQGIDLKTKLPSDFTSVIVKARRKNSEANITSILYFYRGKYFHFVEGPKESIAQFIADIDSDERHDNIEILFEKPIKRRYVEGSPLKLSSASGEIHKGFAQFIFGVLKLDNLSVTNNAELLDQLVSLKSGKSKEKKAKKISSESKSNVVATKDAEGFSHYLLGMSKWPSFSQEDVNSGLLQLCALLVAKQVSYPALLEANPFAGEKELDTALRRLQSLSLLDMTYNETLQVEEKPVKKGFFSKVQTFIKRLQQ